MTETVFKMLGTSLAYIDVKDLTEEPWVYNSYITCDRHLKGVAGISVPWCERRSGSQETCGIAGGSMSVMAACSSVHELRERTRDN
jgi:hypothetical protein